MPLPFWSDRLKERDPTYFYLFTKKFNETETLWVALL